MSFTILDGTGSGKAAAVGNDNRLKTRAITETVIQAANDDGEGFNFNTGPVSITGNTAIMYLKNNGDRDLIVDAIAVGLGTATVSNPPRLFVVKNPTAGTIVSGASSVSMNQNRNFGSSEVFDGLVYKGASGDTFTDGSDTILFYQNANGRLYASTDVQLPKGTSIGIRIEPQLSSGSISVYAALVCHLHSTAS